MLRVEECRANIVQMAEHGEKTAALLVIPHFDFVIVAAGDENRLLRVKADAANLRIGENRM